MADVPGGKCMRWIGRIAGWLVLAAMAGWLAVGGVDASRKDRRGAASKPKPARARVGKRPVAAPERAAAFDPHAFDAAAFTGAAIEPDEHLLLLRGGKQPKRFDQPDEAIRHYLRTRLPEGETELPVERYFAAMDEMRTMARHSIALDRELPPLAQAAADPAQGRLGAWTPLGPGNIGGRTRAILIHPQEPSIMYAAGVAGGVWKSVNAGASWTPISDLIANIAVSAMAMDPKNPEVIYAGTGEGFFNADAVRGAGIFRTTDAGRTWERLRATESADFYYVNDLAVSPNDSRRIYAATSTGIWRSLDGGAVWSRVRPVRSDDQLQLGGCHDMAIRTDKRSDYLYVACGNLAQTTIYRNTDASATGTWEPILTESGMGRSAIAFAPSNQNRVYVIAASVAGGAYQHGLHAFFRSDSAGDAGSWDAMVRNTDAGNKLGRSILSIPPSAAATDCLYGTSDSFTGQSWYDLTIAVDPLDPNRVWVGSVDLFRTDDGGSSWGLAGYVYLGSNFALGRVHPDQHVIVFHPKYDGAANQQMFVGNDGGIYRTENARAAVGTGATAACNPQSSQVAWTALNNGYAVTQFYHGVVAPDGKNYFGGTQDNGTVLGADGEGADRWRMILGADGAYSAIDPLRPNVLYASTQNGGLRKSSDGGATFSIANLGLTEATFINPMAMDPSEPRRLYMGARGVFRSSDGATTWQNATGPLANATIGAIAVSPIDSNTLMAGFSDGTIIRTDRMLSFPAGGVLTAPNDVAARPRQGAVSWIAFEPNSRQVAYATYSTFNFSGATGHVFKTTNGGQTWTNIDGSGAGAVPDIPVHCIVVDPIDARKLYLGTDLGVFVSTDGGGSWSVENTGFANTVTETLAVQVGNGAATLYAFTHGRGAYKVKIADAGVCEYALSSTGRRAPAAGTDAVVDVTVSSAGACSWKAESNASWIAVQPNASGSANGTVGMKILANDSFAQRVGTVSIAGRSFTITQDGQADIGPPSIAIVSPANGASSAQPTVNLSGTMSDNDRIVAVAWRTSSGLTGGASFSGTAWSAASVPLTAGPNTITVSATDGAGNTAFAVVTVRSTPQAALVTVAGTGAGGAFRDNVPAVASLVSRPWRFAFDRAGNMYVADDAGHRVRRVAPNGVITTVAGTGVAGFEGDGGPATAARLNFPSTVAVDAGGNLYIADFSNNRIRKVTAATGVITTVAGDGNGRFAGDGGPATAASLNGPESCAIGPDGNLYIADYQNNRIRRVTLGDGRIGTVAGTGASGFGGDGGPATAAAISLPCDVAFDAAGDLYIAASGNNRIRRIAMSDGRISTFAGSGQTTYDGENRPATSAGLGNPFGIALDSAGNLYFSDRTNNRIRRVNASDRTIVTIAGGGASGFSPDGSGAFGARLALPTGVAVDPAGRAYFADSTNGRVRTVLASVTADAVPPVVTIASPAGGGAAASPIAISGTATDSSGVAVVRWANDRGGSGTAFGTTSWTIPAVSLQPGVNTITISAWDPAGNGAGATLAINYQPQQVLLTLAGTGAAGNRGDGGPATAAELAAPRGIAVDRAGNVYIADVNNRRVRRVSPGGAITAFAGTGELGSGGDGGPAAEATFNSPTGLALDAAGNLYVSDSNLNRVRRVAAADGRIATVAGSGRGFGGYNGDGMPALDAELRGPQGIALDAAGNLYIADQANQRIRRVGAADGRISTIAGTGEIGFSGDEGPATAARLLNPTGVAVDAAGNVYIADTGNQRIRRVSAADGRIRTIAGTGVAGYNGDEIPARDAQLNLSFPTFLCLDPGGNLLVADRSNHRIRRIDLASGLITTIAGLGTPGSFGDGGSPQGANLSFPTAALLDAAGNLYISDGGNNRVRRTAAASGLRTVAAVSAASFLTAGDLAPDSIAVAFGLNLANGEQTAASVPLPTSLGGATLRVRDSIGAERLAPLFFASSGQLNFLVPSGTAPGNAAFTVTSDRGDTLAGVVRIAPVAPGLFSANGDGKGAASALAIRVRANNQLSYEPVAQLDPATKRFVPAPIDLGPETERVILVLFGTGFRANSGLAAVTASVGGVTAPVAYAGLVPGLAGLDQANIELPRSLAGRGEIDLVLTVNGLPANSLRINIK